MIYDFCFSAKSAWVLDIGKEYPILIRNCKDTAFVGYLLYNFFRLGEVDMTVMTINKINELAKEVLEIEANSILRLKNNIGEEKSLIKQLIFYTIAKAESNCYWYG